MRQAKDVLGIAQRLRYFSLADGSTSPEEEGPRREPVFWRFAIRPCVTLSNSANFVCVNPLSSRACLILSP
jgi:hypothetical protein